MNRGEAAVAAVLRPKLVPRWVSTLRFKGRVGGWRHYITLDNPWGQSDYPRYRLSI
jgi:hypothetical protein